MENCSHPNYGMVSNIHLKLGTGIATQAALHDMTLKIERSKVKISR